VHLHSLSVLQINICKKDIFAMLKNLCRKICKRIYKSFAIPSPIQTILSALVSHQIHRLIFSISRVTGLEHALITAGWEFHPTPKAIIKFCRQKAVHFLFYPSNKSCMSSLCYFMILYYLIIAILPYNIFESKINVF